MPARGVAIYNRQSDPSYCSLPLLFYLCLPLSFYLTWPVLSWGRISATQCSHVQCISCILVGGGRPPRKTTCLLIHWVK